MLLPRTEDDPDLTAVYASPPGPWLRVGLVTSVDGSAVLGGGSERLSVPADRTVFSLLRSLPDVVLVGAGTARAEQYRPVPVTAPRRAARRARGQREVPRVAVVSRGPGLPTSSPLLAEGAGTLLLTTVAGAAAAPPGAEPVVCGVTDVDLHRALAALHDRGLAQVLCEGGPELAGALAAAGLVDELCLTTSPVLAGGDGARPLLSAVEQQRPLRLASLLTEADALLARWTVRPG